MLPFQFEVLKRVRDLALLGKLLYYPNIFVWFSLIYDRKFLLSCSLNVISEGGLLMSKVFLHFLLHQSNDSHLACFFCVCVFLFVLETIDASY